MTGSDAPPASSARLADDLRGGGLRGRGRVPPRSLLARQRAVLAAGSHARETLNIGAVLEGRIGTFVIPGCIERLLFARQSARFPMVEHATEFGAFVLRRGDRVRRLVGDRMWTTAETLDRAGDH